MPLPLLLPKQKKTIVRTHQQTVAAAGQIPENPRSNNMRRGNQAGLLVFNHKNTGVVPAKQGAVLILKKRPHLAIRSLNALEMTAIFHRIGKIIPIHKIQGLVGTRKNILILKSGSIYGTDIVVSLKKTYGRIIGDARNAIVESGPDVPLIIHFETQDCIVVQAAVFIDQSTNIAFPV